MSKPSLAIIHGHEPTPDAFWSLWKGFQLSMRGKKRNHNTERTYQYAAQSLVAYLEAERRSTDPVALTRDDLRGWLAELLTKRSPATASVYYSAVRAFLRWAVADGELVENPSLGVSAPVVPEVPVEIITADDMSKLLNVCKGSGFHDRRDTALFITAYDSGLRRGELVNLMVEDVDLELGALPVTGKGGRPELGYLGDRAIAALDRYLRARSRHPKASLTIKRGDDMLHPLWLSHVGKLRPTSFDDILQRRARQAGISRHLSPHAFRHGFADSLKSAGASDEDVQRLGRWRDPRVMQRYARVRADERARQTHRRLSPGDRLTTC